MNKIIPSKLKSGDEIRVIAPVRSLSIISKDQRVISIKNFQKLGLNVTFGKHVEEKDEFVSSSIESRLEDLHDAFKDKNVKGIFTVIGGFNSNQLLKFIDYTLIKNNPKILCGYSDVTALQNAIYAKTGLVSYSGPHFSTLGMKKGLEYTKEQLRIALIHEKPYTLLPSHQWSDDAWYKDQVHRNFRMNPGYIVLNKGKAQGTSIGGNLCTFQLLNGTEYQPSFKDTILLVEDCVEDPTTFVPNFDRDLQSIIHQPGFEGVKGILIGRFETASGMTLTVLRKIIKTKKELSDIPILANVDFGHTSPIAAMPIGGDISIYAGPKPYIRINKH